MKLKLSSRARSSRFQGHFILNSISTAPVPIPAQGTSHATIKTTMSWKSKKEKERFFEQVDKAFNTPATEPLIIPRFNDSPTKHIEAKRRASEPTPLSIMRIAKRQRMPSNERVGFTGVGIRPEKSKSVKKPSLSGRSTVGGKPEEQPKKSNLLDGMVLFFIPNSKKNGVRKFRMTLFAQHGADVRDVWSEDVTHVICDENIKGERVLRDLRSEQFPVMSSL